jgi:hypothetical protein
VVLVPSGWARATSACWRIEATGERSSWEASETKRRCWSRALEPTEHPVHGRGEAGDLVAAGRVRDPPVQLGSGDLVDLVADRLDRVSARPITLQVVAATTNSSTGNPTASKPLTIRVDSPTVSMTRAPPRFAPRG